jgi:phosphatidate phosphatase APP1
MAELYRGWRADGAAFHYVTGSPWHLYLPLEAFLRANDFPSGAWHMKHFRLANPSTVIAMLRSQMDYKLGRIEPVIKRWPKRRMILVGDSGEQDPEVFGELARRHPDRISRIFIRNLQPLERNAPRLQKAFAGVASDIWQLFSEAAELPGSI